MDHTLKEGNWYRLTLPMGKTYTAQYVIERGNEKGEYFLFPDRSRTAVHDLLPFLSEIEEVDEPDTRTWYDIGDFLS